MDGREILSSACIITPQILRCHRQHFGAAEPDEFSSSSSSRSVVRHCILQRFRGQMMCSWSRPSVHQRPAFSRQRPPLAVQEEPENKLHPSRQSVQTAWCRCRHGLVIPGWRPTRRKVGRKPHNKSRKNSAGKDGGRTRRGCLNQGPA